MQTIKEEIEIISRYHTGYVYKQFTKYLWEIYAGRANVDRNAENFKFIGIAQGDCDTYVEAKSMLILFMTTLDSASEIGKSATESHIIMSLVNHEGKDKYMGCDLCNNTLIT